MMGRNLYERFPHIVAEDVIIRKMTEDDAAALLALCSNENVSRYRPDVMTMKNQKAAVNQISRFSGRDFEEKRRIMAGVYLPDDPDRLVGTAEIFGYDRTVNMAEIGYRIDERNWHKGVATKVICALTAYLFGEIEINRIQATVVPENVYSAKALVKNGFLKEGLIRQGTFWPGKGLVDLELYSLLRGEWFQSGTAFPNERDAIIAAERKQTFHFSE